MKRPSNLTWALARYGHAPDRPIDTLAPGRKRRYFFGVNRKSQEPERTQIFWHEGGHHVQVGSVVFNDLDEALLLLRTLSDAVASSFAEAIKDRRLQAEQAEQGEKR